MFLLVLVHSVVVMEVPGCFSSKLHNSGLSAGLFIMVCPPVSPFCLLICSLRSPVPSLRFHKLFILLQLAERERRGFDHSMLELDRMDFAAHSSGTWPHFTDGEMETIGRQDGPWVFRCPGQCLPCSPLLLSRGAQVLEALSLVCVREQVVLALAGKTHVHFYSYCGQILLCLLWEVRERK